MIFFPKSLKLTSLTSSILISLCIVYLIHALFVFPSVNRTVNQTKQELYQQIFLDLQYSPSRIGTVIEKYRLLGSDVAIEPISDAINTDQNDLSSFKLKGHYYQIHILHASFIEETRLALFGSVLLLFVLTFFFTRLITLYIENNAIKQDISNWEKKLTVINHKINKIEYNLTDALQHIQQSTPHSFKEWEALYFKICEFDVVLDAFRHNEEIIEKYSKVKANFDYKFTSYYLKHFPGWQNDRQDQRPRFIMDVMDGLADLPRSSPIFLLVFDSMRLDHWLKIKPLFNKIFTNYSCEENIAWSLLPTYTPYCRNSLLSGLSPRACAEEAYHGKLFNNQYEELLFHKNLKKNNLKGQYIHTAESNSAFMKLENSSHNLPDINALIYMFIDGLTHSMSHTKTDESLFREHILVEFNKNAIMNTLELIRKHKGTLVITSDHGNILAKQTLRVNQFDINGFDQPGKHTHVPERFLTGQVRVNKLSEFKTPNTHLVLDAKSFLLPGDQTHYAFCRGPFKYDTADQRRIHQYAHGGASIYELLVPYVIMKSV